MWSCLALSFVPPPLQVSRTSVDSMMLLFWEHASLLLDDANYTGRAPALDNAHLDYIYNIGSKVSVGDFPGFVCTPRWLSATRC